jgi:regulator of protease activity HflC (stomatin/prohibitin superfamily)
MDTTIPEIWGQTNGVRYQLKGTELENYLGEIANNEAEQIKSEAEAEAKATAKAAAKAKLAALGLTVEDLVALGL